MKTYFVPTHLEKSHSGDRTTRKKFSTKKFSLAVNEPLSMYVTLTLLATSQSIAALNIQRASSHQEIDAM